MPEGPEVHRQADALRERVGGFRTRRVWFGIDRLEPYGDELTGQTVERVSARGKAFVIAFSGGLNVYVHLQLFGRWVFTSGGPPPASKRSLRLQIDAAVPESPRAAKGKPGSAFLYSASEVDVLTHEELAEHGYLSSLGPDLLEGAAQGEGMSEADVARRLREPAFAKRALAALYLDQGFLAGLGNYLRSEILHHARLHPSQRLGDLDARERRRLAKATHLLPRRSYETGGVTNDLRREARLKTEGVKPRARRWLVFEREGEPCYRCAAAIERITVSGRRLYLCPTCQPDP